MNFINRYNLAFCGSQVFDRFAVHMCKLCILLCEFLVRLNYFSWYCYSHASQPFQESNNWKYSEDLSHLWILKP